MSRQNQLNGRLNKTHGNFGILTYRKVKDKKKLLERCKQSVKDDKYIISLDDDEIIDLLKYKLSNQEESIDEFMDEKFKKLDI